MQREIARKRLQRLDGQEESAGAGGVGYEEERREGGEEREEALECNSI